MGAGGWAVGRRGAAGSGRGVPTELRFRFAEFAERAEAAECAEIVGMAGERRGRSAAARDVGRAAIREEGVVSVRLKSSSRLEPSSRLKSSVRLGSSGRLKSDGDSAHLPP